MKTQRKIALRDRAIRWLEDNRGLVIVLFCLPASYVSIFYSI